MSRTSLEHAATPPRRRRQGTAGGFGPCAHYRAIKSLFRRPKHPQVRAKGHLVIPNDIALPAVSSPTCSGRSSSFGAAVIQNARSPTLAPFFATCFLSLVFSRDRGGSFSTLFSFYFCSFALGSISSALLLRLSLLVPQLTVRECLFLFFALFFPPAAVSCGALPFRISRHALGFVQQ